MLRFSIVLLTALGISGCRFNELAHYDKQSAITWYEVINQYQRRVDLIPDIITAVKNNFSGDDDRLATLRHTSHSAHQLGLKLGTTPDNHVIIAQWQKSQRELSQALNDTLALLAYFPELKTDQQFAQLRVKLEGSTYRIGQARDRHSEAVKNYNDRIRAFPEVLYARLTGYNLMQNRLATTPVEIIFLPDIDLN